MHVIRIILTRLVLVVYAEIGHVNGCNFLSYLILKSLTRQLHVLLLQMRNKVEYRYVLLALLVAYLYKSSILWSAKPSSGSALA